MNNLAAILSGSKTYILAVFGAAVWVLGQLGWISLDSANQILTPIGALIVITLRQAIAKTAQVTQLSPTIIKPEVTMALNKGDLVVPSGKPIPKS